MAIEGIFKIEVAGRPKTREDIIKLRSLLNSRILMVDSDANSEIKWFGNIAVILTWTGVPKYIGYSQSLFHMLEKNVSKYFMAYRFSIIIHFEETG